MDMKAATRLAKRLAGCGFGALGGFHPGPGDCVPALPDGMPARTLLLVGNAGRALWPSLSAAPEMADGASDPLDRYTRRALAGIAGEFGMTALFPFDGPPYHPFQQWGLKAGGFSVSPLGVLVSAVHGPWAGFRAAFLSAETFGTFEMNGRPGPCETCAEKPCLAACPANAVTRDGYDVPSCIAYLRENAPADCMAGCLARRACPYGQAFAPEQDQAALHMRSFLDLAAGG